MARLAELGVVVRPLPIADPAGWREAIEQAVRAGPPAMLLGGGDGSFSRGLRPLVGSGVAVGFVPLGTGNGIARSFGIGSLEAACRAVAAGHTVLAGVGRANGHYFLNMASAGISVEVARGVSRKLKQAAGLAAYPVTIARAVLRRRVFAVRLTTPGDTAAFAAVQVIVFNGHYASRWPAPGLVVPGTGLDICALPAIPLPGLALAAAAFWMGAGRPGEQTGPQPLQSVICREAGTATIETDSPLEVNVDGEIITRTPLQLEWMRDAVKVFVARTRPETGRGGSRLARK